jgi:hypothetical protein
LRSALDCIAVQRGLLRDGFDDYEEWLAGAISQAKAQNALAFDLGATARRQSWRKTNGWGRYTGC